jgi:pyruvate ferredoxin oxidoreductase delta subunit
MTSKTLRKWKEIPFGGVPWLSSDLYLTGDWRTRKPVIDYDKCTACLFCHIYCPDASVLWKGERVEIDYDHCKGCGICAEECPSKAIEMVLE